MNSEQNGQQMLQQSLGAIESQIKKQEENRKAVLEQTKNYGKQQAISKVTSKFKDKVKLNELFLNKAPKNLLKQVAKFNESRAKALTKLSNSFLFKNNFLGDFFKNQANKSMQIANKISSHLGEGVKSALNKGVAEVAKKGATQVATKAASAALAAPTGGLSVAVEKAATVAKTAVEVGKKGLEAKGTVDVAKDAVTSDKNSLQAKATNLVNEKTNEVVEKVVPGSKHLQGILNKSNTKEDKNKDTSMAIFSGTKDLAGKLTDKSKGFDLLK